MANPNWVKGMVSPNPGGRAKGVQSWLERLRFEQSEKVLEKLKEAIDMGEAWAITLGAHYCLGKPSEMKFGLSDIGDDELAAEVLRRESQRLESSGSSVSQNAGASSSH